MNAPCTGSGLLFFAFAGIAVNLLVTRGDSMTSRGPAFPNLAGSGWANPRSLRSDGVVLLR